jgi:hypothetical protein
VSKESPSPTAIPTSPRRPLLDPHETWPVAENAAFRGRAVRTCNRARPAKLHETALRAFDPRFVVAPGYTRVYLAEVWRQSLEGDAERLDGVPLHDYAFDASGLADIAARTADEVDLLVCVAKWEVDSRQYKAVDDPLIVTCDSPLAHCAEGIRVDWVLWAIDAQSGDLVADHWIEESPPFPATKEVGELTLVFLVEPDRCTVWPHISELIQQAIPPGPFTTECEN